MSVKRAILIVDDEAILLLSIKQELRLKIGKDFLYETAMSAEQGLEAIDRLAAQGVEVVLIISDWLMSGMMGDEFFRRVHGKSPRVKLMMLSGHADKAQMEDLAAEVELFAFMSKPYDSTQFVDTVHRALAIE